MMKKLSRTLCLGFAAMLVCTALAGCKTDGAGPDGTTTDSHGNLSPEVTTSGATPDTTSGTPTETTPAGTTEIVHGEPVGNASVDVAGLGLVPHEAVSDNRAVAEVKVRGGQVMVVGYLDGSAGITVRDCFGHTATVDVTVSGRKIKTVSHATTDKFIEASTQFGAKGDGVTDSTAAIQAALDSAKPGQTVYLYPGIYVADHLCMPEGVTLEMYTTMTDATAGYTDKLARQVRAGEVTVLRGARIMNNRYHQPGAEGSSHFTVRGGVMDMLDTSKGAIIFGCADGVLLENVIFKDMKNNHAIQYTGCTNSAIRNCMFAGYTWGGTFTREVVQIEVSTPGATGVAATAPLTFSEGEYNYSENIEISRCYFGKSDRCGVPLMAIGHHSQAGGATVTGFRITDNVFDGMMYAAIRYNGIVDTEISGNTFTAYAEYPNVKDPSATMPAFIVLYSSAATTAYTSVVSGKRIVRANVYEQAGVHGMNITRNTFNIPGGSDKRVLNIAGSSYTPGLNFEKGILRQKTYNTPTYAYSGYVPVTNYMEGVSFTDNVINVTGKPKYTGYLMYVQRVLGLRVSGNDVRLGDGVSFSRNDEGVTGLSVRSCVMGAGPDRYVINAAESYRILLSDAGGKADATLLPGGSFTVTINIEGQGTLSFDPRSNGSAAIIPVPAEGYVAEGWYSADGKQISGNSMLSGSTTLIFRFTPQK